MTANAIPTEATKNKVAGKDSGCRVASGVAVGVGVGVAAGSGEGEGVGSGGALGVGVGT